MHCVLCERISAGGIVAELGSAVALSDAFPLNPGHTLVIPRRHEAAFFDLREAEQTDVWNLVTVMVDRLARDVAPDGFNVGINVGEAAGQTVPHAHVHVIPRHNGDVDDPRGGVRWVIPDRADYWSER